MMDKPWEKKNQLLADHASGKMTLAELQTECAYWYLDCFEEIFPRPYPSVPREYLEFKNLNIREKNKLIESGFFFTELIKKYLNSKEEIKHDNENKIYWLKEHLLHIPVSDFLAISKFGEKIMEFSYES